MDSTVNIFRKMKITQSLVGLKSAVISAAILLAVLTGCIALGFDPTTTAAPGDQTPVGIRIDFPTDAKLPTDKFGVFIGIGRYAGLPQSLQLDAPAHDVIALKDIFTTTFGVKRIAILTDEKATRQNIGQVFEYLVEQVRTARQKSNDPISVVIAYAGHGSRVRRTPQGVKDNPNSPDESTWVCADSSSIDGEAGEKDFRASELFKIHSALASLGAQVVMISDACHSGAGFRGIGKVRAISRAIAPPGPSGDLFPNLPNPAASDTPGQMAPTSENFAWYAACSNGQSAWEGPDSHGIPRGYFTSTLCDLLPHITPETTYGELASQISAQFAIQHPIQSPEFHAPLGKEKQRFLRGGFAPVHAEIILPNQYAGGDLNNQLKLNMGTLHGVATGAKFTFYKNSTDFEKKQNPIAVVEVTADAALAPVDCTLPLAPGITIPPTAWAELDAQRMNDVCVGIDGPIPDPLAAKLRDLDAKKMINLVPVLTSATLAIHFDGNQKMIGIYDAAAQLPSANFPLSDPSQPQPLRQLLHFQEPADIDEVCTNLLYVIRVRRLISLTHIGSTLDLLKSEIRLQPNADGTFAKPVSQAGILQLQKDQNFIVHFTNTSRPKPGDPGLYLTIFSVDPDGSIKLLYPDPRFDTVAPLKAGQERDFPATDPPFKASITQRDHIGAHGELTQFLIIETDRPADFSSLIAPPVTNEGHARGNAPLNPLDDLINTKAVNTRGAKLHNSSLWATSRVTFYVDDPALHKKP